MLKSHARALRRRAATPGYRPHRRRPRPVDLKAALDELYERYDIRRVRVDSGGILNGVLLRQELVDEVSMLVYPELVGGASPRSLFVAPDLTDAGGVIKLRLLEASSLRDGFVWLRYEIVSGRADVT